MDFMEWLHQVHESISFALHFNQNCVPYLDTVVYIEHNQLGVRLYVKKTNRNSYLNFRSFHQLPLRTNIPFLQFLRVKRNCTKACDFREHSRTLSHKFLSRGYPETVIQKFFMRASNCPRKSLLQDRVKKPEINICFLLMYTTLANQIKSVIFWHWHILDKIPGCEQKPWVAMRKSRSIKDLVVHTDINKQRKIAGGTGDISNV